MRFFFPVVVLASFSLPVPSQAAHTRAGMIEHFCHAQEVTRGPQFDRMMNIQRRLAPILARVPEYTIHRQW